jgi:hypothetical protein
MKKPKNKQGRKASKYAKIWNVAKMSRGTTYGSYEDALNQVLRQTFSEWASTSINAKNARSGMNQPGKV